jgi:diaminohydroxyphosphoribosylaminopyrimidine deaminase/5-amino-6-(5-phosphoribosylamino)uracil reductase
MIGSGTAQVDNPSLTSRLPGMAEHSPIRVVLASDANLSLTSNLVMGAFDLPVWVVVGESVNPMRTISLQACGCEIIMVSEDEAGRLELAEAVASLGNMGLSHIYAEGGAIIAKALLQANLVDQLLVYESDRVMKNGIKSPVDDDLLASFDRHDRRRIGPDQLTTYLRKDLICSPAS